MTDDRPLTVTDLADGRAPLSLLAERVASCLSGTWYTRPSGGRGAIIDDGDKVKLALVEFHPDRPQPHNPLEFHVQSVTLTGRPGKVVATMNVYTLPSQIAAHLEAETIPQARKRIQTARRQRQTVRERSEHARDFIRTVAEQLRWNSSSYKCHSGEPYSSLDPRYRHRRPAGTDPVVRGQIGYRDSGKGLDVRFAGLDESLVAQIVDLVADHHEAEAAAGNGPDGTEAKEHHEERTTLGDH